MLETWYINTNTYEVLENIPLSTKTLLLLLMPAFFFDKKTAFSAKNSTFTQRNNVRAVLEIF